MWQTAWDKPTVEAPPAAEVEKALRAGTPLAALGVLAAVEIIEWPVALVLGAGHFLVQEDHNRVVQEIGEALEEA